MGVGVNAELLGEPSGRPAVLVQGGGFPASGSASTFVELHDLGVALDAPSSVVYWPWMAMRPTIGFVGYGDVAVPHDIDLESCKGMGVGTDVMPEPTAITVEIRVIPRARRNEVDGMRAGRLLVRTTANPVDGAANEAVRRVLADHFGVSARDIEIISGRRARDKVVRVNR